MSVQLLPKRSRHCECPSDFCQSGPDIANVRLTFAKAVGHLCEWSVDVADLGDGLTIDCISRCIYRISEGRSVEWQPFQTSSQVDRHKRYTLPVMVHRKYNPLEVPNYTIEES